MNLSNILKYFFSDRLSRFWKNSNTRKGLALLAFVTIVLLILFSNFSPQQVMLHVDEVAQRNIVSDINAVVVDENQTDELKQQAASEYKKHTRKINMR